MISVAYRPVFLSLVAVTAVSVSAQTINPRASREFGHPRLLVDTVSTLSPNFVEGRELNAPRALAFDTSVSPPILYVADTGNNRILAWRNPAALQSGAMADRVIGQSDFYSTLERGPGTVNSRGFRGPTGVAVDSSGNLYVADAGNNRILRFPKPLETSGELFPDLVIGQVSVSTGTGANRGQPDPTEKTLALFRNNFLHQVGMTFDSAGNLWVTDGGNNRVLRYPVSQLAANTPDPAADQVIGQLLFTTDDLPQLSANAIQRSTTTLVAPNSLSFDSQGNLFITDQYARALFFRTPNFASAQRILGLRPTPGQGQPTPPYPTEYTLGFIDQNGTLSGFPSCVYTLGTIPFFCDTPSNRLVRYGSYNDWPAGTDTSPSPVQLGVYGQDGFTFATANRGLPNSTANSLFSPSAGAFLTTGGMWIVDSANNRVLKFDADANLTFANASVVLGQLGFQYNARNLVEGRDLYLSGFVNNNQAFRGSNIVIDKTSTPNRLYVSDPFNHRVLAFSDARNVGVDVRTLLDHTKKADLVIGQQDLASTQINFPIGDAARPTDSGLFLPTGLAIAPNGDLFVADTGNARVLRFPRPFDVPQGQLQKANLVLGQQSFTSKITDPTSQTMNQPSGLAYFGWGGLAVADRAHNRILIFRRSGADFTTFQAADAVLGQANFTSTGTSNSTAGLNSPRGMDVDGNDRLYVADFFNNRVMVYGGTSTIGNGAGGTAITASLNQPEDVAISAAGIPWVASSANNVVNRYRIFDELLINQNPTAQIGSQTPLAVALDAFDNIIVADASNRMTFYYSLMVYKQAANYAWGQNRQPTFAPNTYMVLAPCELVGNTCGDKRFTVEDATGSIPYPKVLSGVQVLIDGVPAPITAIASGYIYFIVPNGAATSGDIELLVLRQETGEILAAGTARGGPYSPGIFTAAANGQGPIAAINQDGTINGPANPVGRGEILTIFLTGYGRIDGLKDGEAPGTAINTPSNIPVRVYVGGSTYVADSNILYSGTSPEYPGLWQINVKIPAVNEPGNPVPVNGQAVITVLYGESTSNIAPTPSLGVDELVQDARITKFWLKP